MVPAQNKKCEISKAKLNPVLLVNELEGVRSENKSWFWSFLRGIFESPDLDYSQFEELERKRTQHQSLLQRFY